MEAKVFNNEKEELKRVLDYLYISESGKVYKFNADLVLTEKTISVRGKQCTISHQGQNISLGGLMLRAFRPSHFGKVIKGDYVVDYRDGDFKNTKITNLTIRKKYKTPREPKTPVVKKVWGLVDNRTHMQVVKAVRAIDDKRECFITTTSEGFCLLKVKGIVVAKHNTFEAVLKLKKKRLELSEVDFKKECEAVTKSLVEPRYALYGTEDRFMVNLKKYSKK